MDMTAIHKIYMLGIGGIGMSALARYFKLQGCEVFGYDKAVTKLTDKLMAENINITFDDRVENIPENIDLIIYTPAIPTNNNLFIYFSSGEIPFKKRSDILFELTKGKTTIAVAGTHGKTTISAMVAHILNHSGYGCTAFVGGIMTNYASNFLYNENNTIVVEADEYDRSFLKLAPNISVISAMDKDHLDVYGSTEELANNFNQFANQTVKGGTLICHQNVKDKLKVNGLNVFDYNRSDKGADYIAKDIVINDAVYTFNIINPKGTMGAVKLTMGGQHNIENALAATAVAQQVGIENDKITAALADFKGVKRRFEYVVRTKDYVYIDDYAHHPVEIENLLASVRTLYPNKQITVIFQPHLFSRTKDLLDGFVTSLANCDKLYLLDIYPARELPIPGVTSNLILDKVDVLDKKLISQLDLLSELQKNDFEVILTVGAGDIDQLVETIKNIVLDKVSNKAQAI